jgi:putative transposase
MNAPKCDEIDYIHFLIAAQKVFTCTEAARSQPHAGTDAAPAHDAFTRLLQRQPPDTEALWQEAKPHVEQEAGVLVLDDTTLDKPYAKKMDLVTHHWSGKHKRVVKGINLLTLLWRERIEPSAEAAHIPCDFRLYDKPLREAQDQQGQTKNEHFRAMLSVAHERGFSPEYVVFDSWYSGLDNLKAVRAKCWCFFTRLKSNRLVNPDDTYNRSISEIAIPEEGLVVHLKGFGFVRVFRTVGRDGDAEHWATNDLAMSEQDREELARLAWGIETYHRQAKQYCGIERSQCRSERAQRNHILLSLRAYLRLEVHRLREAVSFYESKLSIMREAVRQYLADPAYTLTPTA